MCQLLVHSQDENLRWQHKIAVLSFCLPVRAARRQVYPNFSGMSRNSSASNEVIPQSTIASIFLLFWQELSEWFVKTTRHWTKDVRKAHRRRSVLWQFWLETKSIYSWWVRVFKVSIKNHFPFLFWVITFFYSFLNNRRDAKNAKMSRGKPFASLRLCVKKLKN